MIFGNINQDNTFGDLGETLKSCFAYVKKHGMMDYEKGRHEINGDKLYVNVAAYETTTADNRFWEAHRQYLDVHVMLKGEEQIDLNFITNMVQKEFVESDDFLPMEGDTNGHVVLREGDFLICYPGDGHRTAIQVGQPCEIKKAIFKVLIER